jgi:spoIIIJ-associated protein
VSDATTSETDVPETDVPETDVPHGALPGPDEAPTDGEGAVAGPVPEGEVTPSEVPEGDATDSMAATSSQAQDDAGSAAAAQTVDQRPAQVEEPAEDGEPGGSGDLMERLENEGDIAADYLEELLDIADLDGDLDMDVEGDRAAVSIVGGDVRQLVGRDGEVLEALQELTRLAVYRETGERSRLMLDVGGFRADKRSRLEKVAAHAVAEVRASGERKALEPMSPFERKVVHDAVAAAGLTSASEGEEPRRYVVVLPA